MGGARRHQTRRPAPAGDALVRRAEVTHANVLSGGAGLVCVIRAPIRESKDGIMQRLPRTTSVIGLDIDLILHSFGTTATAPWKPSGHGLTNREVGRLLDGLDTGDRVDPPVMPSEEDRVLLDVLADDGRAPHSAIAELTGWSPARVKRRLNALETSGSLSYDVDLLPERLGFEISAMLWLTTAPRDLRDVGEQVAAHDEIVSALALSGRTNVLAIVICRDLDHLYRYLAERLATVDGITAYDVDVRSTRLKQTASLISHGRLVST